MIARDLTFIEPFACELVCSCLITAQKHQNIISTPSYFRSITIHQAHDISSRSRGFSPFFDLVSYYLISWESSSPSIQRAALVIDESAADAAPNCFSASRHKVWRPIAVAPWNTLGCRSATASFSSTFRQRLNCKEFCEPNYAATSSGK